MNKKIETKELFNPNNIKKYEDDLVEYFGKGGTWQNLLGYDTDLMEVQYKKAYELLHHAQYKEAAAAFSYLTILNPYQYTYWMGLGIAKQNQQLYAEALTSYTAAEAIEPNNPIPHLNLSQCYYALELNEQAIRHLKFAIEIANDKSEYLEVLKKAQVILEYLTKKMSKI
ncbi:MAG: SycD/LcrH family type III secretion system chaperone [Chlamydiales bacterium]